MPALLAALLGLASTADRPALAQGAGSAGAEAEASGNYRELPVDENRKASLFKVREILREGQFRDGQQPAFDAYYKLYALARWATIANRTDLPKFRRDLAVQLRSSKSGAVHDHLNQLVVDYMENLAKPYPPGRCFHPAARVNAVLMIGELNQVEPKPGVPPKPWSPALAVLLRTLKDPRQLEAVKIAALVGILRHAELGIGSDDAAKVVVADMTGLLRAESDAAGSAVGHAWMKARAANVLKVLRSPGEDGQAVAALGAVVADKSLPLSTRAAAAEAIGALDYRRAGKIDVSAITKALTGLAQEALATEDRMPQVSRRRLKQRLVAAFEGIDAIAAVDPKHQPAAAAKDSLAAMLEVIENDRLSDDDLLGQLGQTIARLQPPATPDAAPEVPDVPPMG